MKQAAIKIAVTGGGSGGHITPILAVADQLKQLDPAATIDFIGQRGDNLGDIPAEHPNIDAVYTVRAGKLRRYHGQGWRQLLDVPTLLKNLRDVWYVFVGFWQSIRLLRRLRPDVLFVKGGFVGVPVGLAAAVLRIPYVTHDSDAMPGLANRIVAPWAKWHAVALSKEVYSYSAAKTVTVGVPVSEQFKILPAKELQQVRRQLELPAQGKVLLVTGGGLGAQFVNLAVLDCLPELLRRYPDLTVIMIVGRRNETDMRRRINQLLGKREQQRVVIKGFITNLYQYSAVADLVVARAGGTSLAELAAQAKVCIIVPNPLLAGGHQLKNAQVLADKRAFVLLPEEKLRADHGALMPPAVELLDNPAQAASYGRRLHSLSQSNAARRLAVLLLEVAHGDSKHAHASPPPTKT